MNIYDSINKINKFGEGFEKAIQEFNEFGMKIEEIDRMKIYRDNISNNVISEEAIQAIQNTHKEKEAREIESLELQRESLQLQKFMVFFMKSINKDNKQIIESLSNLIDIVNYSVEMEEGNLLLIEQELNQIKNSISESDKQQYFIQVAKEKLADKGVDYAMMFILAGLKNLFLLN